MMNNNSAIITLLFVISFFTIAVSFYQIARLQTNGIIHQDLYLSSVLVCLSAVVWLFVAIKLKQQAIGPPVVVYQELEDTLPTNNEDTTTTQYLAGVEDARRDMIQNIHQYLSYLSRLLNSESSNNHTITYASNSITQHAQRAWDTLAQNDVINFRLTTL
jgi:hypothetical protein